MDHTNKYANRNKNLDTINEVNENSMLNELNSNTNRKSNINLNNIKSQIYPDNKENQIPINNFNIKNLNEKKNEKLEDFGFTKPPKFFTSQNKENFNQKFVTTGAKLQRKDDNSTPKLNFYTPGMNQTIRTFTLTENKSTITGMPKENVIYDSILINNFPNYAKMKIFNFFKKFGDIKEFWDIEEENMIVIQFEDPLSVIEAYRNYDHKLFEGEMIVEMINARDHPKINLISKQKENLNEKEKEGVKSYTSVNSPSVSNWSKIVDFFFNW